MSLKNNSRRNRSRRKLLQFVRDTFNPINISGDVTIDLNTQPLILTEDQSFYLTTENNFPLIWE